MVCRWLWTTGACKELDTSEVWYDAEEDLYPVSVFAEGKEQSEEMSNGKIYNLRPCSCE